MFDYRLALMCGQDIPIFKCNIILHQPTIKEIALIGEDAFFKGIQYLTISKNQINVQGDFDLEAINNFQIFMMMMTEKQSLDKQQIVLDLCKLIFPQYKIIFSSTRSMIFSIEGQKETFLIDENNFEYLQSMIKEVFCLTSDKMGEQTFNPADIKAKEIAQKLMRGRERVAAQSDETRGSMFSQYLSTITIGVPSMSLEDCMQLTMFQMMDLVERYSLYVNWDIDMRSRLAGAKIDEKPDNWMKNIH